MDVLPDGWMMMEGGDCGCCAVPVVVCEAMLQVQRKVGEVAWCGFPAESELDPPSVPPRWFRSRRFTKSEVFTASRSRYLSGSGGQLVESWEFSNVRVKSWTYTDGVWQVYPVAEAGPVECSQVCVESGSGESMGSYVFTPEEEWSPPAVSCSVTNTGTLSSTSCVGGVGNLTWGTPSYSGECTGVWFSDPLWDFVDSVVTITELKRSTETLHAGRGEWDGERKQEEVWEVLDELTTEIDEALSAAVDEDVWGDFTGTWVAGEAWDAQEASRSVARVRLKSVCKGRRWQVRWGGFDGTSTTYSSPTTLAATVVSEDEDAGEYGWVSAWVEGPPVVRPGVSYFVESRAETEDGWEEWP